MYVNGNLNIAGVVQDLKVERVSADPQTPAISRLWFNSTDKKLKYFDGTSIIPLAAGGSLDNYLLLTGGTLTGALVLAADAVNAKEAVTKQQLDAGLATKQNNITGAASTVVTEQLSASKVVVSDANGKIAASTVTAAELGLLTGITGNVQTQLDSKQANIGYVPVNKAGDSVNGNLSFGGTATVKNLAAPTEANDAVRKADLDSAISGMDFQNDVKGKEASFVAGTGKGGRYIYGDGAKFDENGFAATVGDIVEVDDTGKITKIAYDINATSSGALVWSEADGVFLSLLNGAWGEFGGLSGVTAGVGLSKSGNTISVRLGAGIADLPNGEVGIELKQNGGLALVNPTTGEASTASDSVLGVVATAGLEVTANGVGVKAAGITESHLNASVAGNGLQGGAGTALSIAQGTGIVVSADGVAFDQAYGDARYLTLTGGTLTGPLVLAADATDAKGAVTKSQMETAVTAANSSTTALETRLQGGYFLYEQVTTAAASHTVTHNMGTKYVQVSVVDENDEVVIPQSITFNTANALTVTFASASLCRIIVTGLKAKA